MTSTSQAVLVVDDDPGVVAVVRRVLMLGGDYEVFCAADGLEALTILRRLIARDPVVISDVNMPRMDGLELARAIRREHELSKVRVIILSSAPPEAAQQDADAVLTKPFEMRELLETIGQLTASRRVLRVPIVAGGRP